MSSGDPRQPKRSWRDSAGATPRSAKTRRSWKQDETVGPKGPFLTRTGKTLLAGGGLLAVLGTIIAVYLWLRPIDPPRLVLIGAGYELNLAVPHNVHGRRALSDLAEWAREHNKNWAGDKEKGIEIRQDDLTSDGDAIAKALDGCTSATVVVFLAVHGGADSQGAFLLPRDANPKEAGFAYRFEKVLAALARLPEKTRKFLILDATQIPADWSLHMVHNDFARALEQEPRLKAVHNLAVLSASGEGQCSWIAEEYGRSAFGHYVIEGLKGAADLKSEGGNGNGVITAGELSAFVQQKVEHWARHTRAAVQKPVLLDPDKVADKMELVGADGSYQPPAPLKYTEPVGLDAAWRAYFDLQQSLPHPAVYAPHLWRQYQETLLRQEALLRANDTASADRLTSNLQTLKAQITQAREWPRVAQTASLTMPAVLGVRLPETLENQLRRDVRQLWEAGADPEDYRRKLLDVVTDQALKAGVRLRVCGLLLDRGRESEVNFVRVCDLLPRLDDVIDPRPTEVEFALVLRHNLDKPWNWPLLNKALELRNRAESAALGVDVEGVKSGTTPYSEQVHRWIKADILRGDQARVLGQDLILTTEKVVKGPDEYLTEAATGYETAQRKAKLIRDALRVRDRSFADLPFYTRWAARQSLTDDEEKFAAEQESHKITAWTKLLELAAALETPESSKAEDLPAKAKAVEDEVNALAKTFKERCAEPRSVLQRHWHELNDLLTVPFIDPDQRLPLLAKLRDIGATLNATLDKATNAGALTEAQNSKYAREAALRQARLALAVLGPTAPETIELKPSVERPDEGAWWRALTRAGDRIGDGFRRMAEESATNVTTGRKAAPADARAPLALAALTARRIDAAAAESWLTFDPVDENRRLQAHDLLVSQAERAWRDYLTLSKPAGAKDDIRWDDPEKPYYRTIGGLYLATATELMTSSRVDLAAEDRQRRLADVNRWEAKLKAPDQFALLWRDGGTFRADRATMHITDEKQLQRVYGLQGAEMAPEGFPVVWERAGPRLKAAEQAAHFPITRFSPKPEDAIRTFEIAPDRDREPTADRETSNFSVQGFFRGRRFEMPSSVVLHYRPDLTAFLPEMITPARISVQTTPKLYDKFAAGNCHLVIVLDCSGSMDSPNDDKTPPNLRKPSRLERALTAIERTINRLPPGVTLSLFTFSAKEDGEGNVTRRWNKENWTGQADDLRVLMGRLSKLTPWFETPLVYSMYRAWQDGFANDAPEVARTLLVITDGADNMYVKNSPRFHGDGESMSDFLLRTLGRAGIQVNVIGFEITEAEKKEQRPFLDGIKAIKGNYFDAADSNQLANSLERSLLRVRFWIEERSGKLEPGKIPDDGADVSRSDRDHRWISGLDPGTYGVALQTSLHRKGLEQRIRVERGDSLVLDLTEVGRDFRFVRPLFLKSHAALGKVVQKAQPDGFRPPDSGPTGWYLGVVQNQQIRNARTREGLQIMSIVEKDLGPMMPTDTLRQARPRWAFFTVASAKEPGKLVRGLRFYPLPDYPAPAWSLDFDDGWPGKAEPIVSAYWSEEDTYPVAAATLLRGTHYNDLPSLTDKSVAATLTELERTNVVVESVTFENRPLPVRPGEEPKPADCVVVRLRYPDGTKPFFAQLPEELRVVGEEHRFYTEAGKYTGVFWHVSNENAGRLASLRLISLEEAKRNAYKVQSMKLGEPNMTARPDKPVD